jgi:hypothetical protein
VPPGWARAAVGARVKVTAKPVATKAKRIEREVVIWGLEEGNV